MITGLQTAQVGDNVRLQCASDGSPTPAVIWRHVRPNHILPNGIMGSYKQSQILDIENIQIQDRGEYECLATNGVHHSDNTAKRTSFIRMNCEYNMHLSSHIGLLLGLWLNDDI